jgi:hypothetical protein
MFNIFPRIDYKTNQYDTLKCVDIGTSAKIKDYFAKYRPASLRPYFVSDGESPEYVSYRVYGTTKYGYIILMTNNVDSIYDQWPKSSTTFKNYIIEKYGSVSYAATTDLYFYTGEGLIISEESYLELNDSKKSKNTILEYETKKNSDKASIKILDYKYVVQFESGLYEILGN